MTTAWDSCAEVDGRSGDGQPRASRSQQSGYCGGSAEGRAEARAAQVGGVTTQAVTSYHDDRGGALLRAEQHPHLLYRRAQGGAHGRSGMSAAEPVLQAILNADVMMIPVGGFYTIDAKGAKEIVDLTRPKCVIPMHYKTKHCAYPIAGVEPFLEIMGAEGAKPVRDAFGHAGGCAEGVVVMEALENGRDFFERKCRSGRKIGFLLILWVWVLLCERQRRIRPILSLRQRIPCIMRNI